MKHRIPHSLEVLSYPFQSLHAGIEPRELLLDGSDDPLLFSRRREGDRDSFG
jgi:hypothetical protein